MNSEYGPPLMGWYGGPRRSTGSDPNMRVSDAERTEMADTLSKHYADGRLDDAELKVRLDKAMASKTRGDLSGLLADLPSTHPENAPRRPGIARRTIWAMTVFAMVVLAIGVATAFTTPHIPWLLVIVVFALLWHRRHGRYHHHHHALSD
jgi:hypothetical protein